MDLIYKLTDAINSDNLTGTLCELIKNKNISVQIDTAGNIITHIKGRGNSVKTMISVVVEKSGMLITKIADKTAKFKAIGATDKSAISDKEVFYAAEPVGIIRSKYKDDKISEQTIELWEENSSKIGDFVALKYESLCKANKLYGFGVNQIIPLEVALCIVAEFKLSVNDIYFTVSFSKESAQALARKINPDYIFAVYCAEATDDFKLSDGCGIVYKDGNAVIEPKLREFMTEVAQNNHISYQPYIGKHNPLIEFFGITGGGPTVGGICIPVGHIKSSNPVADKSDIENAKKLLLDIINHERNRGDKDAE